MSSTTSSAASASPTSTRASSLEQRLIAMAPRVERAGVHFARWALVAILLPFGAFKFTAQEAAMVKPMIEHSPLLGWLYHVTSVQGASNTIGVVELTTAILLASHRWAPRAAIVGGIAAMLTFVTTVSFLFTTPGAAKDPSAFGFLVKDVFLFGAALVATGASLRAFAKTRGVA